MKWENIHVFLLKKWECGILILICICLWGPVSFPGIIFNFSFCLTDLSFDGYGSGNTTDYVMINNGHSIQVKIISNGTGVRPRMRRKRNTEPTRRARLSIRYL